MFGIWVVFACSRECVSVFRFYLSYSICSGFVGFFCFFGFRVRVLFFVGRCLYGGWFFLGFFIWEVLVFVEFFFCFFYSILGFLRFRRDKIYSVLCFVFFFVYSRVLIDVCRMKK